MYREGKGVRERKAYFFIIDAIIGIAMLVAVIVSIYKPVKSETPILNTYLVAKNYVDYISRTKVMDLSQEKRAIVENCTRMDIYITEAIADLFWKKINGYTACGNVSKILDSFMNNISSDIIRPEFAYRVEITYENKTIKKETLFEKSNFNIESSRLLATSKILVFVMNGTELLDSYVISVEVGSK